MTIQVNFAHGAIQGSRAEQQDTKAIAEVDKENMLFVLADGMGGHAGGQQASSTVVKAFVDYFKQYGIGVNPHESLKQALDIANTQIANIVTQQPELQKMGTTVIAVLHNQVSNHYYFLSVGDSPLYKFGANGLKRINRNHAYYEVLLEQVKRNEILQQEADTHPQRHAITSAVMGKKIELIDLQQGVLRDGESILLASDGVQTLDDKYNGELARIIAKSKNKKDTVDGILRAVENKKKPHQDNTTLVLFVACNPLDATEGEEAPYSEQAAHTTTLESKATTQRIETFDEDETPRKSLGSKGIILGLAAVLCLLSGVIAYLLLSSSKPTEEHVIVGKDVTGTVKQKELTNKEKEKIDLESPKDLPEEVDTSNLSPLQQAITAYEAASNKIVNKETQKLDVEDNSPDSQALVNEIIKAEATQKRTLEQIKAIIKSLQDKTELPESSEDDKKQLEEAIKFIEDKIVELEELKKPLQQDILEKRKKLKESDGEIEVAEKEQKDLAKNLKKATDKESIDGLSVKNAEKINHIKNLEKENAKIEKDDLISKIRLEQLEKNIDDLKSVIENVQSDTSDVTQESHEDQRKNQ